jgi:hypothetical protein
MSLRGFGFMFDLQTGQSRKWYVPSDGIKRWADNDKPVEDQPGEQNDPDVAATT